MRRRLELAVEALIAGTAIAIGPPYIQPYESDVCEYDTKDYRRLLVTGDWSGGQMTMKMTNVGRRLTDKSLQAETQTGIVTANSMGDRDKLRALLAKAVTALK
jgi:hypothetical protein